MPTSGRAITRYLGSLVDRLHEAGIGAQLEVMQSSGGTLTPETARRKPAHLVESGPAAGVMACSYLGRLTGRRHLISLDMGGTTAKAAIVEDGQPVRTSEYEVGARHQPHRASSSRAAATRSSSPSSTSPRSARAAAASSRSTSTAPSASARSAPGSHPGPACYGLGGAGSDAHRRAARARLPQRRAARRRRDHARSGRARASVLDRVVATPLGRSVEEAAYGILMLAVATMTRAVKAVTTYRGRDPRDFTLCAFGGNGPLTGVEIARSLAICQVLDSALARRLQRPRAALLRHRARGRAHADAARRRDHGIGARGGVRRDRGRDDGVSRRHGTAPR